MYSGFLFAGLNGGVQVWNMNAPGAPIPLEHPGGNVTSICAHGEFVFTGGEGGSIRVWKPNATGGFDGVAELTGHTGAIRSLAVCKIDQGILVSTSADGSARVWNMATGGTLMQELKDHGGQWVMDGVEMQIEGNPSPMLVTAGLDASIKVYQVGSGGFEGMHSQVCPAKLTRLCCTTSGSGELILCAAQTNGEVVLFNVNANFAIFGTLPGHPVVDEVVALESVPGAMIVSGSADGNLRVFLWQ